MDLKGIVSEKLWLIIKKRKQTSNVIAFRYLCANYGLEYKTVINEMGSVSKILELHTHKLKRNSMVVTLVGHEVKILSFLDDWKFIFRNGVTPQPLMRKFGLTIAEEHHTEITKNSEKVKIMLPTQLGATCWKGERQLIHIKLITATTSHEHQIANVYVICTTEY